MEPDRFEKNRNSFIIGIICLALGLVFFLLCFYTLPNLLFNWRYQIPTFIALLSGFLQVNYQLQPKSAGWLVFLAIFGISIILFIIAEIMSKKIDSKLYKDYNNYQTQNKINKNKVGAEQDSRSLVFKIIFIIILVFIASQLFHWAITI
jgi:hypothetical protein